MGLRGDSAVSTTFSYVLMFAIASILFTGVMWTYSTSAEDVREEAVRQELTAVCEQVADAVQDLSTADLENGSAERSLDLPSTAGGEPYVVEFDETNGLVVARSRTGIEARVSLNGLDEGLDLSGTIYSSSQGGPR